MFFNDIHEVYENQNICIYCNDEAKEDRLREGTKIKPEELTDVFKEITLHVRVEILLSSTQIFVDRSKG